MADSTKAVGNKPRTRQRTHKPPPQLDVPHIEEDASERKRVLNVLAQRRYREKQRLRRLKVSSGNKKALGQDDEAVELAPDDTIEDITDDNVETIDEDCATSQQILIDCDEPQDFGVTLTTWKALDDASSLSISPNSVSTPDLVGDGGSGDDSVLSTFTTTSNFGDLFPAVYNTPPSSIDDMPSMSSDLGFIDSFMLPVHELTILKAMLQISQRLRCSEEIWSLDAISPFNQGTAPPDHQLPVAWRPTTSQVVVTHHPFLDFLPWPSVRDKIIGILSLPDEERPPPAVGQLALVNFAYDIEDNAEGVRIYGGDPYDPFSWEVGQVLFERWWFLFDRPIIENSNRWRLLRGAPPLAMKGNTSSRVSQVVDLTS